MRCIAYHSKLYSALMLLCVITFGAAFFAFREKLPLFVQLIFAALILLVAGSCLFALCSFRPALEVDEDGLHFGKLAMRKIPWHDIAAVVHRPRVEKLPNGKTNFSLSENWRPIDVYITNIESYTNGFAAWSLKNASDSSHPGATRVRLECSGTTAKSQDVYECIRHYVENRA